MKAKLYKPDAILATWSSQNSQNSSNITEFSQGNCCCY